jgi:hypothetical protein
MFVSAHLTPLDQSPIGASQNVTGFLKEEQACTDPIRFQSETLAASGRWSATVTALWLQANDTGQQVFRSQSQPAYFEVAETAYRSTNVSRITIDEKYYHIVPLDWSPDAKSILFSYLQTPDGPERIALYNLDDRKVMELNVSFENVTFDRGYPSPYTTRFNPTGEKILLLLRGDLFSYDIEQEETSRITDSRTIGSFSISQNGKLFLNSNGTLILANQDASNPKIIATLGEHDVYIGDLDQNGEKLLYRKIIESGYGWSDAVLAYFDINEGREHIVPNVENGCGSMPVWAPNGYHIIFSQESCGKGGPGGNLRITDIHGGFEEYLITPSNDNPAYYLPSPDGSSILIAFTNSHSKNGAINSMGGPASFYIMSLATPVPELGSFFVLLIVVGAFAAIMLLSRTLLVSKRMV